MGSTRSRNVRRGSAFDTTARAASSVAVLERDARGAAIPNDASRRRRCWCGSRRRPGGPRRPSPGQRRRVRPSPCTLLPPGDGIDRGVQQQHRAGAGRPWPLRHAEHPARGNRRLERDPSRTTRRRGPPPPSASSAAAGSRRRGRARGICRPVFSRSHSSPAAGPSSDGGVASSRSAEECAEALERRAELAGRRRRRLRENGRMASTVRATSVENTSARPSGDSVTSRGSGRTNSTRAIELHVAHDGRPQRADAVRQRRRAKAGREVLRHARRHRRLPAARGRAVGIPALARDRTRSSRPLCPAPMMMTSDPCRSTSAPSGSASPRFAPARP